MPRALHTARAMERRLSCRTALLATDSIVACSGAAASPPLGRGGAGEGRERQRLANALGQLRRGIGVPRARI